MDGGGNDGDAKSLCECVCLCVLYSFFHTQREERKRKSRRADWIMAESAPCLFPPLRRRTVFYLKTPGVIIY